MAKEFHRPTPSATDESGRVKVIEPPRGARTVRFGELWAHRELLWVLMMRDIKVRYKQSVLGGLWVILRPLLGMAVFTLVFGMLANIPSEGLPYALFVYAALLPWTYFSQAVTVAGNSLVSSAGLVGKVYFPRVILPMASVAGGLIDLGISSATLIVLMFVFGVHWSVGMLAVPFFVLTITLTALGVGTLFSALTVAYRDFSNVTGYFLQIWLFATPVIYPVTLVPAKWRWAMYINPMAAQVEGFRSAFLGRPLDPLAVVVSLVFSLALLALGVGYFHKVERRFADIL